MNQVRQLWLRHRLQSGQTMAEYGLIVALIAVVAITAWAALGTHISSTANSISGCI